MLVQAAATRWSVPVAQIRTENGNAIDTATNARLAYGALAAGARLFPDSRVERIDVIERDGSASTVARGARHTTAPLKRVHITLLDRLTRNPRGALVAEAPVVVLPAGAVGTPVILQHVKIERV